MPSSSPPPVAERARPLLGTLVSIRAEGEAADLPAAVDAAFVRIAEVHRLMSFHEPASDLSRINRDAARIPVHVDPRTAAVVRFALAMAKASHGAFDPTVAPAAVAAGTLPRPAGAPDPDPAGGWRDVDVDGDSVVSARPVWLDLGGVAKGYAVDQAIACLQQAGVRQGCVDAGGDLRVFGPETLAVALRSADRDQIGVVELRDAAVASSAGGAMAAHFDGRTRRRLPDGRFASVVAADCMTADALTKVALVLGGACGALMSRHAARAHLFDPAGGWTHPGEAA